MKKTVFKAPAMPAVLAAFTALATVASPVGLAGLSGWAGLAGLASLSAQPAQAQAGAKPAAATAAKPALTVQAVAVQPMNWPQTVSATGTLAAWQEVVIGAELGGQRLSALLAEAGDRVKKGQLLARLSPGTLEAELAAARAAVQEAEVAARDAAAQAGRVKSLQGTEALSAQAIDQALAAEAAAQARQAAARAQAQAAELRLAYTRILAPHDGLLVSRSAVEGQLVQPGQELFRLQRAGRLEWRAELPAADLAAIKPGQKVKVQPVGAATVEGTVRRIAPLVDAQSRQALVHVDLPDTPGLRAGSFARGEFQLGEAPALTLPQSAVLLRDGFSHVFRLEGNQVRELKVQLGRRLGDRVEVRSGLQAGVQVVASGLGFLADGDTVRLVNGGGAVAPATGK